MTILAARRAKIVERAQRQQRHRNDQSHLLDLMQADREKELACMVPDERPLFIGDLEPVGSG